jgi:DNA-binding NtrC family response regulator
MSMPHSLVTADQPTLLHILEGSTMGGPADASQASEQSEAIVGQSPAMYEVSRAIDRVASQDATVMIKGESGTGKELVARAIWRNGSRAGQPFVVVQCASLSEEQLERELFGYEEGVFVGADERYAGKLEQADGGTVFLDEIGEMSAATRAKMLRFVREQTFERVGGNETVKADVRVITATRSPDEIVDAQTFRQDLLYRINGVTIELPPLRKRTGDIPLLARHFIQRFNREMNKDVQSIGTEAMHRLETHAWPGNVTELQSAIRYAMNRATDDVLTLGCFPPDLHVPRILAASTGQPGAEFAMLAGLARSLLHTSPGEVYRRVTESVDGVILHEALRFAKGNQLHAAALLGISRTTLRAKLRNLGLSAEKESAPGGTPG